MGKYILLLIFVFLLFFSCRKEENHYTESYEVIDLTRVYDNEPYKIGLSEVASTIEYIPLESDSAFLLSSFLPKNIKFYDDFLIVKDEMNKLLMFNRSGRFLTKIGDIGKGAGEYTTIDDFTILPNDSLIVINSRIDKKLLFFDYNGKFIKDKTIEFQTEGLFSFQNHIISINSFLFRKSSNYFNLNVFDNKGELVTQLLRKSDEEKLEKKNKGRVYWGYHSNIRSAYKLNDDYYYWENGLYSSKDTIWKIRKDFNIEPKLVFNIGGEKPELDEYYREMGINIKKKKFYTSIQKYIDTDNFMFLDMAVGKFKKKQCLLRNKKTREIISVRFNNPVDVGYCFALVNDIDGGVPFWPDGYLSNNKIFKVVYGYELKQFIEKSKKSELQVFNSKNKNELLKLVENSKVADNPILMVVTLK